MKLEIKLNELAFPLGLLEALQNYIFQPVNSRYIKSVMKGRDLDIIEI